MCIAVTVLNAPLIAPAISPAAAGPAVTEGGADVVYIRSQALWNVTNFSGTFSSAVQTNFTTALRQLLAPEQFMSIALTQVQVNTSCRPNLRAVSSRSRWHYSLLLMQCACGFLCTMMPSCRPIFSTSYQLQSWCKAVISFHAHEASMLSVSIMEAVPLFVD